MPDRSSFDTATRPPPATVPSLTPGRSPVRSGRRWDRVCRTALHRMLDRGEDGTVVLEEPQRSTVEVYGSRGPTVTVTVRDDRTFRAVVRGGSVGLAESYAEGWWDADDLTGLVRVALRRSEGLRRKLDRLARHGAMWNALTRLRPPTRGEDRRNVTAHYDLSNDLFALMLDPTMTYSCAVFPGPGTSLEEAQLTKFARLARKLGLGPGDRVVEIGSGWGGFALFAAGRLGCRVTTTTISEAQREIVEKRVADRGLGDAVRILGCDYRELEGRFDALVSIEMIEAVDWRRHDDFFATCHRLLTPGGRMGLQAITIADASYERAKHHRDFIRRMIFPGGCLPSVAALAGSLARTGDLRIVDLEDIGHHYPETLRRWRDNVESRRGDIERLGFDERFLRLWHLYLCYCEAAFLEGHVSDVQLVLARPGAGVPPVARC